MNPYIRNICAAVEAGLNCSESVKGFVSVEGFLISMTGRDGIVVTITESGEVPIPAEIREKLQIDTPGKVRFVETGDGGIMIRPVKRPSEVRGALASDEVDESAIDSLRDEREKE